MAKQKKAAVIPASLDLADMEALVRWQVETFCQSKTDAQKDVAGDYGFGNWKGLVAHLEERPMVKPPPEAQGKPLVFELSFSRHEAFQALRKAGLHADSFRNLTQAMLLAARQPVEVPTGTAEVVCPYLRSEYPVRVKVRVLRYGLPTDLRIEVADRLHGPRLQEELTALAVANAPGIEAEREHTALWGRIKETLAQAGVTYEELRSQKVALPRKGFEALIALADGLPSKLRSNLHSLCRWVGKEDRERAARWLIAEFERPEADNQLGVWIWELAMPGVAGDLIRLIEDRRYGEDRGCLCLALAKTRDKRAARVIAAALPEKGVTRWAIEALGMLKAKEHAAAVRAFLQDGNADVRREAKKTLKKMGLPVEKPPAPAHLVKNRRTLPKGLAEWSANLDAEQVEPILEKLGGCVEGFGNAEKAEVIAVMDDMAPDQTRAFQFPVRHQGKAGDVWIVIFMDDAESPDLAVHADPALIAEWESTVGDL